MIRLALVIGEGKTDLTMEGEGSKAELLLCVGFLEDLKHKLLATTQDDGTSIVFSTKKEKNNNGRS